MTNVHLYMVGGAVRDHIMGRLSHDFDFSVEAESFEAMENWLVENDFEIFLRTPKHLTIRARRKLPWSFADFNLSGQTFDFVLCRKDGAYSDGRRPDTVEIGNIFDDLARRDFTMNAIAIDEKGNILDPHLGQADITQKIIRCVGGTERLEEDPLRMLRAFRFSIVLGFVMQEDVYDFLTLQSSTSMGALMQKVAQDRIRDELTKAMSFDTFETVRQLGWFDKISEYIFKETDLWLLPTSKGH